MILAIEPVVSADQIDEVMAIETASFTNPWTRDMYLAELTNPGISHIVLARDERQRAVGFCSFWHILDEVHINNLAVRPECRRTGVASAILTSVLADTQGRGGRRATLEVRRSNDAARQLYERFGFAVTGVRPRYYTNPEEDALVLWRDGPASDGS